MILGTIFLATTVAVMPFKDLSGGKGQDNGCYDLASYEVAGKHTVLTRSNFSNGVVTSTKVSG